MKALLLILVIITAQITLVAAPIQPLDFRVPAGMPDAAQILSPADIQLDGWLGARVLSNATHRLMTVDLEPLLARYRHQSGWEPWVGEYIGKWLHAATLAWAYTGNPALRKRLDYAASELIKAQAPDGYLGTYVPEKPQQRHYRGGGRPDDGADTAGDAVRGPAEEGDRVERRGTGFYDAIAGIGAGVYDQPFLCDLVREVVQAVRRNLKVDWTKPHRDSVKAGVQSAVKMALRRKGVKAEQFDFILNRVMEQAAALYSEWPMVA